MNETLLIFLMCTVNGLIAFIGAFSLFISKNTFNKLLFFLISFSAGVLLSGAFFHLISESLEFFSSFEVFKLVFFGFSLFFLMEKFLYWHHCHEQECKVHPVSSLILIGDALHNFIDGLIIAASFSVSISFGVLTSFMIFLHEIPQEIGDFAVLVYAGMQKKRALILNFLSQLSCFLGAALGIALAGFPVFLKTLLPIAAGGFLYIAASDLIPELHKEPKLKKSLLSFVFFILGALLLAVVKG